MYWWFPPDFWTTNRIYRIWKKLCTSTGVDLILLGGQLGLKKLQCGKVLLEVTFQCACRMSVNGWSGFRRSQKVGELTYFSTVFWKSLFFFGGGDSQSMLQPPVVKVARQPCHWWILIDSDGSDSAPTWKCQWVWMSTFTLDLSFPIGTFHSEPSLTGCPPDWIRLNHQLEHS